MKSIKEKREIEFKRIITDIYRMKRNHENNIEMITFDYLHMRIKSLQRKGLLYNIEIPEKKMNKK